MNKYFIPITTQDLITAGYLKNLKKFNPQNSYLDIIIISGDAFIDHPAFGTAIIARTLIDQGFSVGIIPQPNWKDSRDFQKLGKPGLFFGVTAGNIDSMLHHYTANKKLRHNDPYSENGIYGKRPNRATIVYSNMLRVNYKNIPIVLGGIEASMRRFAHYDYWDDKIRRSILFDSKADFLIYGMAEKQVVEVAKRIDNNEKIYDLIDIKGTAFITPELKLPNKKFIRLHSFETVFSNKEKFAENFAVISKEQNPYFGQTLVQAHQNRFLVVNPPAMPLSEEELDKVYDLPYTRKPHSFYKDHIPAFVTTEFSVVSHRGCYGGCSFCSIYYHQGAIIQSRSEKSILKEIDTIISSKNFKGTITDLGGPSANMYKTNCKQNLRATSCTKQSCLHPRICPNLQTNPSFILNLWKKIERIPQIKHFFIASGIRFDLALVYPEYIKILVKKHTGGHLKVAPEHTVTKVLNLMRKPKIEVFEKFIKYFNKIRTNKQFLVSYMISSHPGCTYEDMISAKRFLDLHKIKTEQVQDFIPLPMTEAGVMFHTGINPFTKEKVFVEKTQRGKLKQRYVLTPSQKQKRRSSSKRTKNFNKNKKLKPFN